MEGHLVPSILHDRVVELLAVLTGVLELLGELMSQCEMESKATALVEVLGDGWRDKFLELIKV